MTERMTEAQAARLAQLTVQQGATHIDTQRAALELQLRQWCVEQAVAVANTGQALSVAGTAAQLFEFIVKALDRT
jgi:hypothetical protein